MTERIEMQSSLLESIKIEKEELQKRIDAIMGTQQPLNVKPKDMLTQEEFDEMQRLAGELEDLRLKLGKIDSQMMDLTKEIDSTTV